MRGASTVSQACCGRAALPLVLAALTIPTALLINSNVPNPYMDEEFHVRQVQNFCRGHFTRWDPMITTFPGLYVASLVYSGVLVRLGALVGFDASIDELCEPGMLRSLNVVLSLVCAVLFREIVLHLDPGGSRAYSSAKALTLSLYPLHWFFNFLYYTELGSATAVMAMYLASLKRAYWSSALFGAVSILFRQTNVVWIVFVVCVGILDFLESGLDCKKGVRLQDEGTFPRKGRSDDHSSNLDEISPEERTDSISHVDKVWEKDGMRKRQSRSGIEVSWETSADWKPLCGDSGKKPLQNFANQDVFAEVLALIKSAWLKRNELLWNFGPLILVLLAFMGFVLHNGSVVVGDKSSHKVSPHFAQFLYCGLICACFQAASHISPHNLSNLLRTWRTSSGSKRWLYAIITFGTASVAIRYYSPAHPYLLADNRHYVFYLWKDLVQKHWSAKYLLIPLYIFSWLSILLMLGRTQKVLWILVFCLAVAGVLVPTPLLEFRYYNVPFYFMFLHNRWKGPHANHILALTTIQFITVNVVTVYIFLYWPFQWPNEPGKVQRFMW